MQLPVLSLTLSSIAIASTLEPAYKVYNFGRGLSNNSTSSLLTGTGRISTSTSASAVSGIATISTFPKTSTTQPQSLSSSSHSSSSISSSGATTSGNGTASTSLKISTTRSSVSISSSSQNATSVDSTTAQSQSQPSSSNSSLSTTTKGNGTTSSQMSSSLSTSQSASVSSSSQSSSTTASPGPTTTAGPSKTSTSGSSGSSSQSSSTGQSSTTAPPPIVTLSSASTTSIKSVDGKTTNTHITTTDSDGHKTIIPVLFGCSFCGGGGIELWGFGPGPGTFEWPPDPKFSNLPEITLDSDNDPSEVSTSNTPSSTRTETSSASQSSSSSSQSKSCTRSSITQEPIVTCSVMTVSGQSTASTTCQTSTTTITGCDISATASTTTTTVASACFRYTGIPVAGNDDDMSDVAPYTGSDDSSDDSSSSKLRRSSESFLHEKVAQAEGDSWLAGNATYNLAKRDFTSLGQCSWDAKYKVRWPGWPAPKAWPPRQAKVDPKQAWWYAQQESCDDVMELVYVADPSKLTPSISKNKRGDTFDIDHAYEKALPQQFLRSLFSSSDAPCDTFVQNYATKEDGNFVNPPTDPSKQQGNPNHVDQTRLQSLINLVPNGLNVAFIGLDKKVNGIKGKIWNPNLDQFPNIQGGNSDDATTSNINIWAQLGMAINLLNQDVYQQQFAKVQDDIFAAFNAFDDLWCGDNPPNFADQYKEYMSTLLKTNLASVADKATQLSNSLMQNAVTTDKDGNKNQFATQIDKLMQTYPPKNMAFPTDSYLQFPESTYDIQKRAAACTPTSTASTSKSSGGSSGPTSTKSSSASGSTSSPSTTPKPTSTASKSSSSGPIACSMTTDSINAQLGDSTSVFCMCAGVISSVQTSTVSGSVSTFCPSQTPTSTVSTLTTSSSATSSSSSSSSAAPVCAPTTGPAIAQSDLEETVGDFCQTVPSSGVDLTSKGVVGGPYYRGAGTATYSVTLVSGSVKLGQDTCKSMFNSIVNGCAPFQAPSSGSFEKYGGFVVANVSGGSANFSLPITEAQAIGRRTYEP